jgi:hypothetical protein
MISVVGGKAEAGDQIFIVGLSVQGVQSPVAYYLGGEIVMPINRDL